MPEIMGGNVNAETVLSLSESQLFVMLLKSSSHSKILPLNEEAHDTMF